MPRASRTTARARCGPSVARSTSPRSTSAGRSPGKSPLEEVHVEPDGTFTLVVGRSAVELVLGVPPFRRKLDQAARVVAELDRRGAKADAIMLDNDARPERVVVRMR